ncbi:MAG: hypothetical protein U9O18_08890 [Chloroflexota bacterium]|nr:hypothetical protein [Chloroflexota bacterium]
MDDLSAFERAVAAEVIHGMGPSEPVADLAVFNDVTAATKSRRWGFKMFSALKFAAAAAIVALFGGFLLTGVFTTQQEDEMLPAAATESPSPVTAQMLNDISREGWINDDLALLEEVYAPNAVHTVLYFDGRSIAEGRAAVIDAAMRPMTITETAPIVELAAPEGELRWAAFADLYAPNLFINGAVCVYTARDDQIIRHDCMLPMGCLSGVCTP